MSSARLGLFLLLLLITNKVWGEVIKTPDGKGNSQQVKKKVAHQPVFHCAGFNGISMN
jgi:hypothetical protein